MYAAAEAASHLGDCRRLPQPGRGEEGPLSPSLSPGAPVGSLRGGATGGTALCPAFLPPFGGAPAPPWTRQAQWDRRMPNPRPRPGDVRGPESRLHPHCHTKADLPLPWHTFWKVAVCRGVSLRSPREQGCSSDRSPAVILTAVANCSVTRCQLLVSV